MNAEQNHTLLVHPDLPLKHTIVYIQVRTLFIEKMPRVLFMQRPHYHPKYTPGPYSGGGGAPPGGGTGTSSRASTSSSPSSGSAMAEKGGRIKIIHIVTVINICIQGDTTARRLGYVGISSVSYQGYPVTELMST